MITGRLSVALFTTKQEFNTGCVHETLEHYLSTQPSVLYKIPWYIIFDQGDASLYTDLHYFEQHPNVESINIVTLNIPDNANHYSREYNDKLLVSEYERLEKPILGMMSGPNHLFFQGMKHMMSTSHHDILLLEADTRVMCDNWYDILHANAQSKKYLMMGSVYKGNHQFDGYPDCPPHQHLNGVAIYKNCEQTRLLIKQAEEYIITEVKKYYNNWVSGERPEMRLNTPWDMALYYSQTEPGWKRIENAFVRTDLIGSFIGECDIQTTVEEIQTRYPDIVILHQKHEKSLK